MIMSADFSYDPVTAQDEASARGRTAEIFADIRATMGLPLLTSIWRGLADMEDSLEQVWAVTKPLYRSGAPEQALARVLSHLKLPRPAPLTSTQLACLGVGPGAIADIRAIAEAYNRSNGMNLMAMAALITPPGLTPVQPAPRADTPTWPVLRPLLAREAIAADTWEIIREVNGFGASGLDAAVATLWRHLAHWPALLAVVHAAFAPLQVDGRFDAASARLVALALAEGAGMAHLRPARIEFSPRVMETLAGYVRVPAQVARMVVLGNVLTHWLR